MSANIIIEPEQLEQLRTQDDVVIVDLCQPAQHVSAHIPGARYLPYGCIVRAEKPRVGLLPEADVFSKLLSNLGIDANTHIIAYDDEGGGCASRLVWTLNVFGHTKASTLNGGIVSWANEGHETTRIPTDNCVTTDYKLELTEAATTDYQYIQQHLDDDAVSLLDARSPGEFSGEKRLAERAGRIPGAKHYEWTDAIDKNNNMRLLPTEQIQSRLDTLGLTDDKEIICYCQSHHRSAFSWVMLKSLGYENVKGYPGSWSDWGNRADVPIEI